MSSFLFWLAVVLDIITAPLRLVAFALAWLFAIAGVACAITAKICLHLSRSVRK